MSALLVTIDHRGVAEVRLNRPELHNAFDDALIAELTAQLQQLNDNPAVRAVVLAANGKSFSAGADLNWMQRMAGYNEAENFADSRALAALMHTLNGMLVPTVARVQGPAYGGGVGLVACCDIAIASDSATFALTEVKLGLIPAVISPYVIGKIGVSAARRYFLTAERFDATTAKQLGLVHEVVDRDELDSTIETLLTTLLANGPHAMAAAKMLIQHVGNQRIEPGLIDETAQRIARIRASAEGKDGLRAFLDKRPPGWVQPS
ncbi:MAG: enoyl-CoA hydratase/isomerase family protein [Chitinivorax sp.]